MKILFTVFVFTAASALVFGGQLTNTFSAPPGSPLRVIADAHVGTNELLQALRALQASKMTNEPAEFWTAIANNTNYNVNHRRRAILQLFARHIKPGMTLHQIGLMLDHPTWLKRSDCGWFIAGAPLPFGALDDEWAWMDLPYDDEQAGRIWFRFKANEQVGDVYNCLEGRNNHGFDDAKVIGIVSLECFSGNGSKYNRRIYNRFGLSDGSDAIDELSPVGAVPPPKPPQPPPQLR